MTKNEIIRVLADIITILSNMEDEQGVGLYLAKKYWLTPSICFEIAEMLESINNEDYGEGNWTLDKEVINKLRNHRFQNEEDII